MQGYSRRIFFETCFNAAAFIVGLVALGSCGEKKNAKENTATDGPVSSCDDLSHVSTEDLALRKKLGYTTHSPIAESQCQNCNLYLPPKTGQACGGCMLFKGPVYASSYCTYWAPKI
jgi:hypothetical protein